MAQPAANPSPMSADMSGADADPTAMVPDAVGETSETLVTICKNADGTYTVYAGDEPDASAGTDDSESEDDDAALSGQGAPAMPPAGDDMSSGKQCATIGAALKAALDILNEDKSSEGGEGSSEDQFQAGYSGDQASTPMMGKK